MHCSALLIVVNGMLITFLTVRKVIIFLCIVVRDLDIVTSRVHFSSGCEAVYELITCYNINNSIFCRQEGEEYWYRYTCPLPNPETGVQYYNDLASLYFAVPSQVLLDISLEIANCRVETKCVLSFLSILSFAVHMEHVFNGSLLRASLELDVEKENC